METHRLNENECERIQVVLPQAPSPSMDCSQDRRLSRCISNNNSKCRWLKHRLSRMTLRYVPFLPGPRDLRLGRRLMRIPLIPSSTHYVVNKRRKLEKHTRSNYIKTKLCVRCSCNSRTNKMVLGINHNRVHHSLNPKLR